MKSIKEAMEEAGYEEITCIEYYKRDISSDMHTYHDGNSYYFKKKEEPKFPKNFEDSQYKITVSKDNIVIDHKHGRHQFHFHIGLSIPLLEQAIDYRREHTK